MSDGQPPRPPGDPGPNWWPRFSWRQSGLWMAQGFGAPLAIFISVWLIASIGFSISDGDLFGQDAIRKAGLIAVGSFFLTGGAIVLTQIFLSGARWKTLFRFIGFTLAMVVQWNLSDLILGLNA